MAFAIQSTSSLGRSPPPSPPFTIAEFAELVSAALDPPRPPPSSSLSSWSVFPGMSLLRTGLQEDLDGSKHGCSSFPKTKTREGRKERCAFEMERVEPKLDSEKGGMAVTTVNGGVGGGGEGEKDPTLLASSPTMASANANAGITVDPVSINTPGRRRRRPLDQKSFNSNHIHTPSHTNVPKSHLCGPTQSPSRPPPQERRRSTVSFAPLPLLPSLATGHIPIPKPKSRKESNNVKTTQDLHSSTHSQNKDPMILFAPPPVLNNNNNDRNTTSATTTTTPTPNANPTPIISATMSTVDLSMNCLTALNVAVGGSPSISITGISPSAYGSSSLGSAVGKDKKARSKSKSKSRSVSRSRIKKKEKEKEKTSPGLASGSLLPSPLPLRARSASASVSGPYLSSLSPSSFPSSSRLSAPAFSSTVSPSPSQSLTPHTSGSGSGSNPLALRVFAKIKKQLSRNSFNVNTANINTHDISSASCPNTPISGAFNTNVVNSNKSEEGDVNAEGLLPLEYRYEYEFDFPYEFGVVAGGRSSSPASGTSALSPPRAQVRERARSVLSSSTSTSTSVSLSIGKGKGGKGMVTTTSTSRYPSSNNKDLGFTSFAALSASTGIVGSGEVHRRKTGGDVKDLEEKEKEEQEDASMSTSRGGRRRGRTGRALHASDDDEGVYSSSSASVAVASLTASPSSLTSSASSYSCESAPFSLAFLPGGGGEIKSSRAPLRQEEEMLFSGHPYAHPELLTPRASSSSSPSLCSGVSVFDVKLNHDANGIDESGSGSSGSKGSEEGEGEEGEGHDSDATSFIGSSCSFFVRMRARTGVPTVGVFEALGSLGTGNAHCAAPEVKTDVHQAEEDVQPYAPYVPLIIQLERERMKEKEKEREKERERQKKGEDKKLSSSASASSLGSRSRSSTTPTPTPVGTITPIPTSTATATSGLGGLSERRALTNMRTGTAHVPPPPPLLSPSTPNRLSASSDASNASFESEGPVTPRTPVFVVDSEDVKVNGKGHDGTSKTVVVQAISPSNETNTIPTSILPPTPTPNSTTKNASPPSRTSTHRSRSRQSLVPNGTSPPMGPLPLIPIPNSADAKAMRPSIPRRSSRRGRVASGGVSSVASSNIPSSGSEEVQKSNANEEPEQRLSTSSSTTSSCVLGSIVSSSSSSTFSTSSSSSPVTGYGRGGGHRFPTSPLSFSASISDSDNSEVVYETPMQTPTLSLFPRASAEAEAEAARVLAANTRANASSGVRGKMKANGGQIGVGRQIVRRGEVSGGDWTLLLGVGEDKDKEKVGGVKRCASNVGGGKAKMNGRVDLERTRTKSESALRSVAGGGSGGRVNRGSVAGVVAAAGEGGREDWTLSMNLPMPGSVGRMGVVRRNRNKAAMDGDGGLATTARPDEITLTVPRVVSVGSGIEDAIADEEKLATLDLLDDGDRPVRGLRNTKSCGVLLAGDDSRLRTGRGTVARMSSVSQLPLGRTTTSMITTRTNSIGSRHARKVRGPALPLANLLPLPLPRPNSSLRPSSVMSSNSCSSSTSDPELTPTPAIDSSFPFPKSMTRTRTQTPDVQESSDSMCSVDYYSARSSFALEV